MYYKNLYLLAVVAMASLSCNTSVSNERVQTNDCLSEETFALDSAGEYLNGFDAQVSSDDIIQIKLALYHFYQHVRLEEDGYYYCELSSGKEIGVSEGFFNELMLRLDDVNKQIKAYREQGIEVDVPDISEEYLSSLLE